MKYLYLVLLITYSLSVCSQESTEKEGFLWKISGNELEQPSYLYGTVHNIYGEFLEKVPRFNEAFDSVQQLIVELYPIDNQLMVDFVKEHGFSNRYLPENIKYSDLFTKEEILYLDSILTKYWNTTTDKISVTPNALYENLRKEYEKEALESFSIDSLPADHPLRYKTDLNKNRKNWLSMDLHIIKKAEDKAYHILGLESLEYQLKLKYQTPMPLELQAKSLILRLKNHDKLVTITGEKMTNAIFIDQDINRVMAYFDEATRLSGFADSYALSPIDNIKERNENWIPTIQSMITRQPSMIAVGAGHLPGKHGLITLLRKEGYTVEEFK